MDNITAQPLLNYLLALSYINQDSSTITTDNLNAVYSHLVREVYAREWAGYQHPGLYGMEQSDFIRMLEEIGIAAWHGNGRTTTVKEVDQHCQNMGLTQLFSVFEKGIKDRVPHLLAAFYFRQHGYNQDGEKVFKFTHKSFGEYLTARRIVRGIRRITEQIERRMQTPDDGWDKREALEHWIKICGPTAMDQYVFTFLRNEMRLYNVSEVTLWQLTLSQLIEFVLKYGLPMERLEPRPRFHEEIRKARNSEEILLAALNACAQATKIQSKIHWPSPEAFGTWISSLRGQRSSGKNVLAMQCLSWLDIQGCNLYVQDFFNANLSETNLKAARLALTTLQRADLSGAELQEVNLQRADLQRANLQRANLQKAYLKGSLLQGAILKKTDLRGADLQMTAGLTSDQLADAIIDETTCLPYGLSDSMKSPS